MSAESPRTLFKLTTPDGHACNGGTGRWDLPTQTEDGWTPGKWRSVKGPLVACTNGLHLVDAAHLLDWLPDEPSALWLVETAGETLDAGDKLVARMVRLLRPVEAYTERTLRLFACDCAERVLPIFLRAAPGDTRPATAIAVARRFANGEATSQELAAARAAAWAAARDAAGAAVRAAAWAAAGDAARDAAWAAAGDAERKWQVAHLAEMLGLDR